MEQDERVIGAKAVLDLDGLQALMTTLAARGYQVLAPTLRDDAILYDDVTRVADLPAGWTDKQEAGRYRLEKRTDKALFGYAVGPHSWKRFLHPPTELLWQARRDGDAFVVAEPDETPPKFAFIGIRSCEVHAIAIQDRVLIDGPYLDTAYRARRQDNFMVAVNCGEPGGTCFCVSMSTGPKVEKGFDLALTELLDGDDHCFLIESGSAAGADVLAELPHRTAAPKDLAAADAVVASTASRMGRQLDTKGLKELLQGNPMHKQWDDVAARCLSCGNCTMVCPTCFCTSIDDHTDLTVQTTERVKSWASCFTMDFSYIHGGSVRAEPKSRYRQWMTHKLANWVDQFGTSGCVGCGRCITWCPTGIDITAEAAAIRAEPSAGEL
jgi:ferredoxin